MRESIYSVRFNEMEDATLARIAERLNQKRADVLRWLVNTAGGAIVDDESVNAPRAMEVVNEPHQ